MGSYKRIKIKIKIKTKIKNTALVNRHFRIVFLIKIKIKALTNNSKNITLKMIYTFILYHNKKYKKTYC